MTRRLRGNHEGRIDTKDALVRAIVDAKDYHRFEYIVTQATAKQTGKYAAMIDHHRRSIFNHCLPSLQAWFSTTSRKAIDSTFEKIKQQHGRRVALKEVRGSIRFQEFIQASARSAPAA